MDAIHVFLNLLAPFIIILSFIVLLPIVLVFKFMFYMYRCAFPENMAGKVVLITGASSGIGKHVAYEYAKRGACLVLCARREEKLQKVAQVAKELGSTDVITVCADVSKMGDCKLVVEKSIHHFGQLDHLVNNAGITAVYDFERCTDPTYLRHVMDTNFWSSVYTIRFAIPYLRKSKGRIIVISSCAAWFPSPRICIYNSSKAALISLYETLRIELGADIGITIVTPGYVESEMTEGLYLTEEGKSITDKELLEDIKGITPLECVEDCCRAIVKSAIRGDRYLTEPGWMLMGYYYGVFFPEIFELFGRVIPQWKKKILALFFKPQQN